MPDLHWKAVHNSIHPSCRSKRLYANPSAAATPQIHHLLGELLPSSFTLTPESRSDVDVPQPLEETGAARIQEKTGDLGPALQQRRKQPRQRTDLGSWAPDCILDSW